MVKKREKRGCESPSQCALLGKLLWIGLHLGTPYPWDAAEVSFETVCFTEQPGVGVGSGLSSCLGSGKPHYFVSMN